MNNRFHIITFNEDEIRAIILALNSVKETIKFIRGFEEKKDNNELFVEKLLQKLEKIIID